MTVRIYWELDPAAEPKRGEPALRSAWSAHLADPRGRANDRQAYYAQIARAAAMSAFDGLFIRYRPESDDSQILAATLARLVPGLRLVPEFPASIGSAVYAAKEAVSFQRSTQARLAWAIAPDRSAADRAAEGDHVAQEDLLARLDEFLTVARGVHAQTGFSYKGRFFEVQNGGFAPPLDREAFPPVILQGTDEDILALSARQADIHLFEPASPAAFRHLVEQQRRRASDHGREQDHAVRLTVTSRDTAEEAARDGEAGLVGSHEEVADTLADYVAAGAAHLIVSGAPSVEEAYRIGAHVLPRLRARLTADRAAA